MTFEEILDQAVAMLARRGRVTYRVLQRQFALDDAALADLKDELLFSYPQVTEEDGRGLVWVGADSEGEPAQRGNGEKGVVSSRVKVRVSSDSMVSHRCLTAREGRKRQRDEYRAESDQGEGGVVGVSQATGQWLAGVQSEGLEPR